MLVQYSVSQGILLSRSDERNTSSSVLCWNSIQRLIMTVVDGKAQKFADCMSDTILTEVQYKYSIFILILIHTGQCLHDYFMSSSW